MYTQRPLDDKDLKCHVCGKPAKWYDREFHSSYVLGEALCDECNNKFGDWKEIKSLKPYIGLDGKIVCDFEQCPLKKQVSFPIDIKHLQVIAFAKAMDDVLCKNDHKGGWGEDKCSKAFLRARLVEEMGEYFRSVAINLEYQKQYGKNKPVASKELVDIANFAMMLWDRS